MTQRDETQVTVKGVKLNISMEGLTPIEVEAIAQQVEAKMTELEPGLKRVDTQKLAILTAMHFAAELFNLEHKSKDLRAADSRKIEELAASLKEALDSRLF
ncbi:MAG TPA: cell division protein ZapA [Elusimicrobiales bacterium]|nr:cell division protein ZapA [Elusimicrobiales bacterium]